MIVTLDGEKVNETFAADDTLQSVIDGVRTTLLANRMVVGVSIDGQACNDQVLSDRLEERISGVQQIDLESGDPRAISAEALRTVASDMQEVAAEQIDIADEINAGNIAKAVTRIGEFVKAWQSVRQVIVQTSTLLQRDLTQFEYDGQPLTEHLNSLVTQLNDLKSALDAQDMVLLADLLHFEVPPLCEMWKEMLNELADDVVGGNA